jgi:hypothetical protein
MGPLAPQFDRDMISSHRNDNNTVSVRAGHVEENPKKPQAVSSAQG